MASSVTATAVQSTLSGVGANILTQTIAVASGDKWAIALVHAYGSSRTISSITFNGSAMTSMGTALSFGGDSSISGYRFDVSGLSAGSYTCTATLSGEPSDGILGLWVLAGADTPTGWVTDTGTATTLIDIAVTGSADGIAIWGVGQDVDDTLTPSGGETEVYDGQFTSPSLWYYASAYHKATSGTTTTSNIAMTSGDWAGVGLFVPAAAGGGGGGQAPRSMAIFRQMGV